MACRRFFLRRTFVPYLEGGLPADKADRLERHLRECATCRALLRRLQAGHRLAERLERGGPEGPDGPPDLEALLADVEGAPPRRGRFAGIWEDWLDLVTTRGAVQVLAVIVVALLVLLAVTNRRASPGGTTLAGLRPGVLDVRDFLPLRIGELPTNTRPYIATEGFVRDVHVDAEEKTLHFKLAESAEAASPYIICEIMRRADIPVPVEGSRVRVYGVARFDAQAGRGWHEVNPVLNIAVLKR
jgi:hypothetical protein